MSDITGNAITVQAIADIENAIESRGRTKAKEQVGKAIMIGSDAKGNVGVKLCDGTDADAFVGIVKAVSGEARATFAQSKMINDLNDGSNPTYAPYYEGNVTVPAGKFLTVERNCISYIAIADGDDATEGDLITVDADGEFKKAGSEDTVVGRLYSAPSTNNIARAYIKAL